jgi:ATP-binding cassette subfamily B protein
LLLLLPRGGAGVASLLTVLQLVRALTATVQAVAVGRLVATLLGNHAAGRSVVAVVLVVGVFLVDQLAWLLTGPVRTLVVKRIDGDLRARVRALAAAVPSLDALEGGPFQDRAARAVDSGMGIGRERSVGTAAVTQLELIFRMLSAVTATALLATISLPLAAGLLAAALTGRAVVQRQWRRIIDTLDADTGGQRLEAYVSRQAVAGAAKDVRLFGLSNWLAGRFRAAVTHTHAPVWREMLRVAGRQWWLGLAAALAGAAVLTVPAVAVWSGQLDPARLMTAVLAGFGVLAIGTLGMEAFDIEYGLHGLAAAEELTRAYRDGTARRQAPRPAGPPPVRFENVIFSYPGSSRPVLDGLTLTLHPGQTVAVVGENGVGKTTFVKLLAGLYLPTSGRITVGDVQPHVHRPPLAVLFQDFVRYPASLRENVRLGAPEYDGGDDAIREALRRAGADIPRVDLDTLLWREGTKGTDLSGGQWQRVGLARVLFAVAAGRRLLVLDEPTANLDVRAEAEFHERVVSQVHDATTVLISHRLSTVRSADRIILLRDGRVAEDGTHEQLLALGGEYARFFTTQAAAFTADAGSAGTAPAGRS